MYRYQCCSPTCTCCLQIYRPWIPNRYIDHGYLTDMHINSFAIAQQSKFTRQISNHGIRGWGIWDMHDILRAGKENVHIWDV